MPDNVFLIGRILQKFQLITAQQFDEVVRAHEQGGGRTVGEILLDRGLLTPEQGSWLTQAVRHYETQAARGRRRSEEPAQLTAELVAAAEEEVAAASEAPSSPSGRTTVDRGEREVVEAEWLPLDPEPGAVQEEQAGVGEEARRAVRAGLRPVTATGKVAIGILRPVARRGGEGGGALLHLPSVMINPVEIPPAATVVSHDDRYDREDAPQAAPPTEAPGGGEVVQEPVMEPVMELAPSSGATVTEEDTRGAPGAEGGLEPGAETSATPAQEPDAETRRLGGELERLLQAADAAEASDLHLHPGQPPRLRVHGELRGLVSDQDPLRAEEIAGMLHAHLSCEERERLRAQGAAVFGVAAPGGGRLRCAAVQGQRGLDVVLRLLPRSIPSLEDLGLPPLLSRLFQVPAGLLLCTGPLGSGRTTTLASLLARVLEDRGGHLVTVEDPIEFVHAPVREEGPVRRIARQIQASGAAAAQGLRSLLRGDCDLVGVGELDGPDVAREALALAASGRLVLGVLAAGDGVGALQGFLGLFPREERGEAREALASCLVAVVAQRLLRRADGRGRLLVPELLWSAPRLLYLLREDRLEELRGLLHMQREHAGAAVLLSDGIQALLRAGVITEEEAQLHAPAGPG